MREAERDDPYVHHFPDGNAGLARLLVKAMIPEVGPAAPGMDGIVLDRFDYALLDREGRPVRLRLSTTAVRVEPHGGGVAVGLVGVGGLRRIEADAAILACNAGVIPALCPALRDAQKAALLENVRLPLVYANVVVRDWTSFQALTVHSIAAPMAFWSLVKLDFPVSLGGYAFPKTPDEPMVLHMVHAPMEPIAGATQRDQARIGRAALLETPFESYEARILDQLDRMLGPGGFVAARDVLAITVNRWPHGYSYYANPLFDDEEAFAAIAARTRTPFGRIAIGLSDTGFDPYAHTAIDEGLRAAGEVLAF
jgi:spermidine dehydrogenase